jgi:hypothetical protein
MAAGGEARPAAGRQEPVWNANMRRARSSASRSTSMTSADSSRVEKSKSASGGLILDATLLLGGGDARRR